MYLSTGYCGILIDRKVEPAHFSGEWPNEIDQRGGLLHFCSASVVKRTIVSTYSFFFFFSNSRENRTREEGKMEFSFDETSKNSGVKLNTSAISWQSTRLSNRIRGIAQDIEGEEK